MKWLRLSWGRSVHRLGLEAAYLFEDDEISFVAELGPWCVRLALPNLTPWRGSEDVRTGFAVFGLDDGESGWDRLARVEILARGGGWSSSQLDEWPWRAEYGWTFLFHPFQWVVGALEPEWGEPVVDQVALELPEGTYAANITVEPVLFRRRWGASAQHSYFVQVDVPGGVSHPGKGTTADNCGEDRLHGVSFHVDHPEAPQVLGQRFVQAVNQSRARYPL